jgi:CcmD family protein
MDQDRKGSRGVNEFLARPIGERIGADWVVMIVALVVWGAVFFYLMRLDRRVRELDKR